MVNLNYLTITEAHELLVAKNISAQELTEFYIAKIRNLDPKVRAILTICESQAIEQAKQVDAKITSGADIGLLEGIPYTAKDMFMTKGIRTTAASKILEDYIPPYSATVIEKLDQAGAVLIAKVNQDEFAHGGSTENSSFHATHNPWNLDRVPGGSSGGSAASVAADFGIFSLGTDTGGSIRQPASYCGITGFKPTYGVVSRYGVIAMASSFDCVGPLARSAEDVQIVFEVIAGKDSKDSTTIALSDKTPTGKTTIDSKLKAVFYDVNDDEDSDVVSKAVAAIEDSQLEIRTEASIKELLPLELALAAYYVLVPSEISSNLERYDGVRYGSRVKQSKDLLDTYLKTRSQFLGPEVVRRNIIGTYALSAGYYDAYYKKAMQVRTLIIESLDKIFADNDAILIPTTLQPAFQLGAKSDPVEMYKTDLLTVFANLAGVPAISIPIGFEPTTGLPMGLQIIGRQGDDIKVLAIAKRIQSGSDWHNKVKELKL